MPDNPNISNEQLQSNPEWGLWLNFNPESSEIVHQFCGPHEIQGATCPDCSKPLLRLISLSATDPRLNLDPAKTSVVHLLYCWTCSIPYGVFSYRLQPNGNVELLELPARWETAFGPGGPYDGYTGIFPSKTVSLIRLSELEQEKQRAAQSDNDLSLDLFDPKHQVGGFPVIANPQEIICPVCSKQSPLFAVICDDASGNKAGVVEAGSSFTDNSSIQMVFHLCRDCSVVSAYHSND